MSTSGGGGGGVGSGGNCLDFLHCNKCFYPLNVIPNDSPHRPFSLTNCWHIFCGVCFEKNGAKSTSCCVCSRSSVRSLRLESPMPDNVKRLFYNYVAEWEANQVWADERRRAHASALREVAKALEDIARELSSSSSSSSSASSSSSKAGDGSSAAKKTAQAAKFQQDQWRSLARGYAGIWTEFRKSRDELKKYQNELHNVHKALREADEETKKLKEKLRECQRQQQQQHQLQQLQQQRKSESLHQQQTIDRPTTSTPAFFDTSNPNGRSPFFRKNPVPQQQQQQQRHRGSGSGGRENRDPALASGERRRSASPFRPQPKGRRAVGVDEGDKRLLQTPKIFADANDLGNDLMTSPYFGSAVGR